MRILYLKNDPSIDRSIQFAKMSKYEIVEAAFFDDALLLLETDCFDVLLIDHGANPETVQFIVGARALHPDLPVFVISAWGADLRKALESMKRLGSLLLLLDVKGGRANHTHLPPSRAVSR